VHLGLYGGWTVQPHDPGEPPAAPRGAVRLRLTGGSGTADLRGPTTCEVLTPPEKQAVHDRLGADPLRADADPDQAWRRIGRSRSPIGALLMRQDLVAGVGNVYRAEVLFRAGLDPHRPGREVTPDQWLAVWADLVRLLRAGVRAGRIVTTRPEDRDRADGRVRRQDAYYVYRRAGLPCRVCGTAVLAEPFVARTLYRCPVCQPA
jgi:formamidopyrimidine-DNA glycosylase